MPLRIDHIALNVEDEYAMVGFYEKVLLLSGRTIGRISEGRCLFSVRSNQRRYRSSIFSRRRCGHLIRKEARTGKTNLNHFCLAMDKASWNSLRERLTALDVAVEDGPVTRWGAWGKGTSIYFRDPEGNLIEARYYEAG